MFAKNLLITQQAKKKQQKNQRIFFAQDASTYFPEHKKTQHTHISPYFLPRGPSKKGSKINLFLCSFHISVKIHLHQKKKAFVAGEFYRRNFRFCLFSKRLVVLAVEPS
jgi:hypothetical protein